VPQKEQALWERDGFLHLGQIVKLAFFKARAFFLFLVRDLVCFCVGFDIGVD